jgi:hypothetical protein
MNVTRAFAPPTAVVLEHEYVVCTRSLVDQQLEERDEHVSAHLLAPNGNGPTETVSQL